MTVPSTRLAVIAIEIVVISAVVTGTEQLHRRFTTLGAVPTANRIGDDPSLHMAM